MEIMLYQELSQEAAAGAPLVGQLTGGPHQCGRAQDHLWLAVAAAAAGEGAEGTIKEHLGFQSFLLWPPDGFSRCLSKG